MTLKEFDVQIALGLIPYTTENVVHRNNPYWNIPEFEFDLVLNLGDKKYSSRDYPWMKELSSFTALHYQIYTNTNLVRSTLIDAGILI